MIILYSLALLISLLIAILLIRFLWMVPNALRDISFSLYSLSSYLMLDDDDENLLDN